MVDTQIYTPESLATNGHSDTGEIMSAQGGMDVESSRAIASVQASMVMAAKRPRREIASWKRMKAACSRLRFAEKALFAYRRGGTLVSGPTIRLAESLASAWGNLDMGFKVIEKLEGGHLVQVFCHDLESNLRVSRELIISKNRYMGGDLLKAERDIAENISSVAQRNVRNVVLQCLPADLVEDAISQCQKTMAKGDGRPLQTRIRDAVVSFEEIGISVAMLEDFLGHNMEATEPLEIPKLQGAYQSITSGMAKREELFNIAADLPAPVEKKKKVQTVEPSKTEKSTNDKIRDALQAEKEGRTPSGKDPSAHVPTTDEINEEELVAIQQREMEEYEAAQYERGRGKEDNNDNGELPLDYTPKTARKPRQARGMKTKGV
ncbi:MAG: hypothetical protein GY841_15510 [FCB group bacterium]|nr:hypothetical protein [FCB group bacterium]